MAAESAEYQPIQLIRKGAYADLYKVRHQSTGQEYAMKVVNLTEENNLYGWDNLVEIDVLSRFRHPHIISAKKLLFQDYGLMEIILPLGQYDLDDLVEEQLLSWPEKLSLIYKLATALDFMHENHLLHRDIKANNIILVEGEPMWIDFGLSVYVPEVKVGCFSTRELTNRAYRAPEVYTSQIYNAATDIWAFGITILYLISEVDFIGPVLAQNNNLPVRLREIFQSPEIYQDLLRSVNRQDRPLMQDLMENILQVEMSQRYTARQICQHSIFDSVRQPISGSLVYQPSSFNFQPQIVQYGLVDLIEKHFYQTQLSYFYQRPLQIYVKILTTILTQQALVQQLMSLDLIFRTYRVLIGRLKPAKLEILVMACAWLPSKMYCVEDNQRLLLPDYLAALTEVFPSSRVTINQLFDMEQLIIETLEGRLCQLDLIDLSPIEKSSGQ